MAFRITVALIQGWVLAAALFLGVAAFAPPVSAQSAVGAFDPYPLRPADTSSPRDTLQSFRTSALSSLLLPH